jgi:hypothetical protein
MRFARLWSVASLAVVALVVAGCGDGAPSATSSTQEGTVTGTVTIHGKPMKGGEITFNPTNNQRKDVPLRTGKIGDDGTYSVNTLVGFNSVRVSGPAITKEPGLGYANQTIEVTSGSNTLNIVLPPPQK